MSDRATAIYRSPSHDAGCLAVSSCGVHYVKRPIRRRTLPSFAVVLVERGQGVLETETGRWTVEATSLFWLMPQCWHSYGPDEQGWSERWALFEGSMAANFLRQRLLVKADPVVRLQESGEVRRLFQSLHDNLREDTLLGQAGAAAALHAIVVEAARQASTPADQPQDAGGLVAALRDVALQDVDLARFARGFDMSPATLRRHVLAQTGLPPKGFQLRLRLDRAKELLAMSDAAIEAVAASVGFDDPFYFSRLFKKREGCSPRQFRARHNRM